MKLLIAFDGSPNSDSAIADLQLAGLPDDSKAVVLSVLDSRTCSSRLEPGAKVLSGQAQPDFQEARDRQLAVAEAGAELARRLFPS
ncbi:MAG: hypothetical protein AB7G11_12500 [Phycisphaerales bacterium]